MGNIKAKVSKKSLLWIKQNKMMTVDEKSELQPFVFKLQTF